MLHCVDCVFATSELSATLAPAYLAHVGADFWRPRAVSAPKNDSLPGLRRLKGNSALNSEMQANAFQHRGPR
jgi:hypothetical protein